MIKHREKARTHYDKKLKKPEHSIIKNRKQ